LPALAISLEQPAIARGAKIVVPTMRGLDVQVGDTVAIPGAESAIVHQFDDGRIVVVGNHCGIWSHDGGRTWTAGPRGPDDKTTINLGGGEVLSIHRTSVKRAGGKYELSVRRSTDHGETWQGAFQFAASDSYCNLVEVAPDKILVIYYRGGSASDGDDNQQSTPYAGTFFTVNRK